jgi:hypothetical protein
MGVSAKDVEVLERVVVGLPRVAEALVPLAPDDKERALAAVERAYQKAATEFGYSQPEAEGLGRKYYVGVASRAREARRFNLRQ